MEPEAILRPHRPAGSLLKAGTGLATKKGAACKTGGAPEMAQKYERLFHQPEDFIRLGHRMMVVRVPDEAVCPEESKTTPPKDAGFDR